MIAKTLIFVCAAFGLVAGSCFQSSQQQQQFLAFPAPAMQAQLLQVEQQQPTITIEKTYQSAPAQYEATPVTTIPLTTSARYEQAPAIAQIESSPRFETIAAPRLETQRVEFVAAPRAEAQRVEIVAAPRAEAQRVELIAAPRYESAPVEIELSSSGSSGSSAAFELLASSSGSSSDSYQGQVTNGPETSPLPMIQAPAVTLPAVESPLITLSSPSIPAPRVIASKCVCTKTILKPQVYQRTITVPKIQRYLKRTVTPVVENVAYKSKPMCSGSSSSSSSGSSNGGATAYLATQSSSSGSGCGSQILLAESGSSCGCRY